MRCESYLVRDASGNVLGVAKSCGSRRRGPRCWSCGATGAGRQCDAKTEKGACDRHVCVACATSIGPEEDLCPEHAAAAAAPGILRVQTAKLGFRGQGWLDVSLKGNRKRQGNGEIGGQDGIGLAFAPSPTLLYPLIEKRKQQGGKLTAEDWSGYVAAYTREMRESYRRRREAWDKLLSRPHVVLLCFCAKPFNCHRTVLARDILPKLGAVYAGEVRS
jgi:uncharacterized protein YeaO (DUF488 family)